LQSIRSPFGNWCYENEYFIASGCFPIYYHTSNAIYLEDEEMAVVRLNKSLK
jgi:glucosamine--fructose-6-phosphate aminotransferase (isomerizing)